MMYDQQYDEYLELVIWINGLLKIGITRENLIISIFNNPKYISW